MTLATAKAVALDLVCILLEGELHAVEASVDSATQAATHTESKPENKYDTRGLEASYLAGAQAERAAELRSQIARLRAAVLPTCAEASPVTAMTLIELVCEGVHSHYLLLPVAGGYSVSVAGNTIKTLTAQTPLGRALMGKRAGDAACLPTPQGEREYEIVSVA